MRLAFPSLTPAVRAILLVLSGSFIAQTIAQPLLGVPLFAWLALHYDLGLPNLWQWATYILVEYPSDRMVVSRALDLLFIYFWLTPFEQQFGARRTFILAALATLAGGILPFTVGVFLPSISLVHSGASPIFWAGLAALAVTTRGRPMNWVLLPEMNAWTLAGIFLLITGLQCTWMGTPTPLLGALGGFAAGIFYTRHLAQPKRKESLPRRRGNRPHLRVLPGQSGQDDQPRWLN